MSISGLFVVTNSLRLRGFQAPLEGGSRESVTPVDLVEQRA